MDNFQTILKILDLKIIPIFYKFNPFIVLKFPIKIDFNFFYSVFSSSISRILRATIFFLQISSIVLLFSN